MDDNEYKYREDYKTDDPAWSNPPNKNLLNNSVSVRFKKLTEDAQIPEYQSKSAAGMDLRSIEVCGLLAGEVKIVSTGFAMALPEGYEAQIRPRSGLAAKYGVTVLNSPGTIDSDYRGEVKVILINHGKRQFNILPGDRIAQMVIAKCAQPACVVVTSLDETGRGSGGFGSTGTK
jgi:dUTP pyrophosphatase